MNFLITLCPSSILFDQSVILELYFHCSFGYTFFISNQVDKGQALNMGRKLIAIFRKKVFFQTLINEITLPEMQFSRCNLHRGNQIFPRICLKRLSNLSAWVKNRVTYKKCVMELLGEIHFYNLLINYNR